MIMHKPLLALAAFTVVAFCSGAALAQTTLQPIVSIETDPNGTANVRVAEQIYSPFTPAITVQNQTEARLNVMSNVPILVSNVRGGNSRYGVYISSSSPVSIDRYTFVNWEGEGSIYGGAIKVDRSAAAATLVQRAFADGQSAPDASYSVSNTDFIGVERNGSSVYVRGATGRNFGDAGVDAKSNVYLMNVTIDGAHRGLRAWSNSRITIANSIINVPAGHEHVWLSDSTSSVRYYNVLWCVGATNPSPSNPACKTSPTIVRGDKISSTQARQQTVALSTNPLPATSNFFRTQIDRIVIEYSRNGGAWQAMASGGASGRPPLGDTRYRVPFSLSSATYRFRVHFERNGARVGSTVVVNEAGQTVSP
jgi:hypothetical protein